MTDKRHSLPWGRCAFVMLMSLVSCASAADPGLAATAMNELGIALHARLSGSRENLCLSPYSIQSALAMAYAGAAGDTRKEMERALHFAEEEAAVDDSLAAFRRNIQDMAVKTVELAEKAKQYGGPREPIELHVANGLFGRTGYDFRDSFIERIKSQYGGTFESLDFAGDGRAAAKHINRWVEDQTKGRIRNLMPGALDPGETLVLVNATYLKAPWAKMFPVKDTSPQLFHIRGGAVSDVPTMQAQSNKYGFRRMEGFVAVSVPYVGNELQLLILLPDDANGLAALEAKLTAEVLSKCAGLERAEVKLHLPRFKIEAPTMELRDSLEALGMKAAFNEPPGSANFDRIAPRKWDYLYISSVLHKTFIEIDERGTEAAAATAVRMLAFGAAPEPPRTIEVRVDRPFFFAIQHRPTGACLFMGRVMDPR